MSVACFDYCGERKTRRRSRTHAPHYSYAALASESLVPFPAASLSLSPPLCLSLPHSAYRGKKKRGGDVGGAWLGIEVRIFNSIRFIWLRFIWFHFVLFCVFVYRFSLRFGFIFICRRWKIVRISCDINRTRERERKREMQRGREREFFHCQLPCVAFHCFCHNGYAYLWGTRERERERGQRGERG